MTQEFQERYWWCKGSGDAWMRGPPRDPTWAPQWARNSYRQGYDQQTERCPAPQERLK